MNPHCGVDISSDMKMEKGLQHNIQIKLINCLEVEVEVEVERESQDSRECDSSI